MKILSSLAITVLAVLAPLKAVAICIFVLVGVDLILGLGAAKKRGELITSAGFRRTITKLFIYETVMILGFLTETYLTGPLVPVSRIIAGYVGLTELKSSMENLNVISGTDLLSNLIKKLGSANDSESQ